MRIPVLLLVSILAAHAPAWAADTSCEGQNTFPALNASQDDYTYPGRAAQIEPACLLKISASTAAVNITGIGWAKDGAVRTFFNTGSNAITFVDNSSSSTVGYRITLNNGNVTLNAGDAITLTYDGQSKVWRGIGATTVNTTGPLSAGAVTATSVTAPSVVATSSIQGGTSKALTGGAATTFATVAVPQTALANYAAGAVYYTVYARQGTDYQALHGTAQFAAVNAAGTETCAAIADVQTAAAVTSSTLTCTITCVTGLTDMVGLAANCASGLTETTLTIEARVHEEHSNAVAYP